LKNEELLTPNACKKIRRKNKGVVFDNIKDIWIDYGGRVRFGIRIQYMHKSKNGLAPCYKFVCCKEGLWKSNEQDYTTITEVGTNCPSRIW